MKMIVWLLAAAVTLPAAAQSAPEGAPPVPAPAAADMTNARLGTLLRRIDADVRGGDGRWQLTFEGYSALVVTDEAADRMRIMVPVAAVDDLDREQLHRLLQANFDSALDARYAVAQGRVWAVFLHPLASLSERELFSGLGQVITAAATFGTTYSSGVLLFQGGDSAQAQEEYYRAIMERGLSI